MSAHSCLPPPAVLTLAIAATLSTSPSAAQTPDGDALRTQLQHQQAELSHQRAIIETQQDDIEALKKELFRETSDPFEVLQAPTRDEAPVIEERTDDGWIHIRPKPQAATSAPPKWDAWDLSIYGSLNYMALDWATNPDQRNVADVERLVFAPTYRLSDSVIFEAEIEFEHGGTGATMEFDVFEEFGEFEQEIEKGGEIVVEALDFVFINSPAMNWRIGHFNVPVGYANTHHQPRDTFTVLRSETDSALVPVSWHETGIELFGRLSDDWRYQLQIVTGLDSSAFSSGSWVASGAQGRFEKTVAEDLAVVARVDYGKGRALEIGGAFYTGDSANNRPKDDLDVSAQVQIIEVDARYHHGPWSLRGMLLRGTLENADKVLLANKNLSNFLNVKRNAIGASAEGWFIEAGYNVAPLLSLDQRLDLFARYDDYDTLAEVEGVVADDEFFHRQTSTVGFNYHPLPKVVFKGEYSSRQRGREFQQGDTENTIAIGVGFSF